MNEYIGEERRSAVRDGVNFTDRQISGAAIRVLTSGGHLDDACFTEGSL